MSISLMIAGMPNSGKTTFIAALHHCLKNSENSRVNFSMDGLSSDERHLNYLSSQWLNCEQIAHTKEPTESWVELRIKNNLSGEKAVLNVPDLRGELFEQPATKGVCEAELLQQLTESNAILLFLNADVAMDDLTIAEEAAMAGVAVENPRIDDSDDAGKAISIPEFKPSDMAEEAKIVELLQTLNRRPLIAKERKVALVISGWDAVLDSPKPKDWLERNRPMISQYLKYNDKEWNCEVYGLSAQGGKLPDERQRLMGIEIPSERIVIVGNNVRPHDITAPLQWLLDTPQVIDPK